MHGSQPRLDLLQLRYEEMNSVSGPPVQERVGSDMLTGKPKALLFQTRSDRNVGILGRVALMFWMARYSGTVE